MPSTRSCATHVKTCSAASSTSALWGRKGEYVWGQKRSINFNIYQFKSSVSTLNLSKYSSVQQRISLQINCVQDKSRNALRAWSEASEAYWVQTSGTFKCVLNILGGKGKRLIKCMCMLQVGLQWAFQGVLLLSIQGAVQPLLRSVWILCQRHLHRSDQPHVRLCRQSPRMVRLSAHVQDYAQFFF